jgi:hypothetical protein
LLTGGLLSPGDPVLAWHIAITGLVLAGVSILIGATATRRQFSIVALLALFVAIPHGCAVRHLQFGTETAKSRSLAMEACKSEGVSVDKGPVAADSYVNDFPTTTLFSEGEIKKILVDQRYKFVEERSNEENGPTFSGEGLYVRYFLAEAGSPACRNIPYRLGRTSLRQYLGLDLPKQLCIAVTRTPESAAAISFGRKAVLAKNGATGTLVTARNNGTGKFVAEEKSFVFLRDPTSRYYDAMCKNYLGIDGLTSANHVFESIRPIQPHVWLERSHAPALSLLRQFYDSEHPATVVDSSQPAPPVVSVDASILQSLPVKGLIEPESFRIRAVDVPGEDAGFVFSRGNDLFLPSPSGMVRTSVPMEGDTLGESTPGVEWVSRSGENFLVVTGVTLPYGPSAPHFWIMEYDSRGILLSRHRVALPQHAWMGENDKPIVSAKRVSNGFRITLAEVKWNVDFGFRRLTKLERLGDIELFVPN